MSTNATVLLDVGYDWTLKVARIVPEAICYGMYLVLMTVLVITLSQGRLGLHGSNIFLILVAILMFLGGTIFLCLDVSDLVRRMQIVLINHPEQTDLQQKLDQANNELKKLVWVGEILFVFMIILGDSVVVWRTWVICFGRRQWLALPMATWLGSCIAGLFELGCDLKTHWAINDLTPSAASVGARTCSRADLSSYTLSYVTNIFCTSLVAFRTWEHRKVMRQYLGAARKTTQVEKVLVLVLESGFVYIVLCTLQAVPIYGAKLKPAGLTAFNIVNSIIQQAFGIYPTLIIVLVKLQKSVWDAAEVSKSVHSNMKFAGPGHGTSQETETVTHTMTAATHTTLKGTNSHVKDMCSETAPEKRAAVEA